MNGYRIVLADDHVMMRAGLKNLIERDPVLKVVAEADDGEALLSLLEDAPCDLVVLDISMPEMDGIKALRAIREDYPKVKVLILTMHKDPEHFRLAMNVGASGYLLKDDAYEQLPLAIKVIMKGKQFISPTISSGMTDRYLRTMDEAEDPSLEILTKREKQILKLVAAGLANKNIAEKFKISIRTVEKHRANFTQKLGIKSTAALVKYAMAKGLN